MNNEKHIKIKWLTVMEVAEIFGVKPNTVYSYPKLNIIPLSPKRINNGLVWDERVILECLEAVKARQENKYKRGKDASPRNKRFKGSNINLNGFKLAMNLMNKTLIN